MVSQPLRCGLRESCRIICQWKSIAKLNLMSDDVVNMHDAKT
jgi:hypothetical protein